MAVHTHGTTGTARRRFGASLLAIAIAVGAALLCGSSWRRGGPLAEVFVIGGGAFGAQGAQRGHATQLRARMFKPAPWVRGPTGSSPYYSNEDRERLARSRKEMRIKRRQDPPVTDHLNYDNLPPIDDIYGRAYSGDASKDGPGGRKRYTMSILYKFDKEKSLTPTALKAKLDDLKLFMLTKMSCKDLVLHLVKADPLNNNGYGGRQDDRVAFKFKSDKFSSSSIINLEYPMKEYGEVPRGLQTKPQFDKAVMVEIDFMAPVGAVEYIMKRLYGDNGVLRLQVIGHTRTFSHIGEDNELHL